MARPKAVIPTVEKKIQIHAELCTRMELELFSDVEGKIPYGAQSGLINDLLRKHYKQMDSAIACAVTDPQLALDAYPEFATKTLQQVAHRKVILDELGADTLHDIIDGKL